MHLSPAILIAAYEYFRATPPFARWKLPPPEDVQFHVTGHLDRYGDCGPTDDGQHCIRASGKMIDHTITLMGTMAHEMVHLKLEYEGHRGGDHGREFMRLWRLVCKHHGFDPRAR